MKRYDLTRIPLARTLLAARGPQLALQLTLLAGLVLVIVAGLLGTAAGSRNLATVGVWIGWWAALMLVAVPLFGRSWCSVCPLPLPGEWLQRGALLQPRPGGLSMGRRWPKRWRGMWLQTGAFLGVALFSVPVLTDPRLTAWLLVALVVAAVALSMVYERRAFCRYLCPIGGFVGLYSQAAPVEVRVRDPQVCADHKTKTCYTGSAAGYGCPWLLYPANVKTNVSCGVCLECLRTCPLDNVAVNLRSPAADLVSPKAPGTDEVFKSLLLLGSALVYAVVLLGPFGALRSAAAAVGSVPWLAYAVGFLLVTVGAVPGLFLMAARLGRADSRGRATLDLARSMAPALIPLGIASWAAFSLGFVLANLSYLGPVVSDPLNLGWNLIGATGLAWSPISLGPWPAVAVLAIGLGWTSLRIRAAAERLGAGVRLALPMWAYSLALVSGMLWVFVG